MPKSVRNVKLKFNSVWIFVVLARSVSIHEDMAFETRLFQFLFVYGLDRLTVVFGLPLTISKIMKPNKFFDKNAMTYFVKSFLGGKNRAL